MSLRKTREAFLYFSKKFPCFSKAKIKDWILVSFLTRELVKDKHFNNILKSDEK